MPARQPSSHNRQRCYPNWVVVVRCRCPLAGILPRGWPWWAAGHWPDTRCRIALTACYEWWYNDGALASFCRDRSKLGRILPLDRFSRFCRKVEILASYRQKRGDATALRDLNGGGGAVNRPFACREAEQQVAIIVRAIAVNPSLCSTKVKPLSLATMRIASMSILDPCSRLAVAKNAAKELLALMNVVNGQLIILHFCRIP